MGARGRRGDRPSSECYFRGQSVRWTREKNCLISARAGLACRRCPASQEVPAGDVTPLSSRRQRTMHRAVRRNVRAAGTATGTNNDPADTGRAPARARPLVVILIGRRITSDWAAPAWPPEDNWVRAGSGELARSPPRQRRGVGWWQGRGRHSRNETPADAQNGAADNGPGTGNGYCLNRSQNMQA